MPPRVSSSVHGFAPGMLGSASVQTRVLDSWEEAMKSSALEVDPKRYGRLLARKLPAVLRTEEENERRMAELEQLDERDGELSPEEREAAFERLRHPKVSGVPGDTILEWIREGRK